MRTFKNTYAQRNRTAPKRSRKKIWTVAAALALVVAVLPFVGLNGAAEDGAHRRCIGEGCGVCELASMIYSLPADTDTITIENAAQYLDTLHAIDRAKIDAFLPYEDAYGDVYEDVYEDFATLCGGVGYGGMPTRFSAALDRINDLGMNDGGWFLINKSILAEGKNIDFAYSDAQFRIERVDGGIAPMTVTLSGDAATMGMSWLSASPCAASVLAENGVQTGWQYAYPLPAGTYRITEVGSHTETMTGEPVPTTASALVDGEYVAGNSTEFEVTAGGEASVGFLNEWNTSLTIKLQGDVPEDVSCKFIFDGDEQTLSLSAFTQNGDNYEYEYPVIGPVVYSVLIENRNSYSNTYTIEGADVTDAEFNDASARTVTFTFRKMSDLTLSVDRSGICPAGALGFTVNYTDGAAKTANVTIADGTDEGTVSLPVGAVVDSVELTTSTPGYIPENNLDPANNTIAADTPLSVSFSFTKAAYSVYLCAEDTNGTAIGNLTFMLEDAYGSGSKTIPQNAASLELEALTWGEEYKLTFAPANERYDALTPTFTFAIGADGTVTLPQSPSGVEVRNSNHIVVALEEVFYTVQFMDGSTVYDTASVPRNMKAERPSPDPTKADHIFVGWYFDEGLTIEWDFDEFPVSADNTKIYVKWAANSFTVKFDANGGTGTMNPQIFTYGTPQSLTANAFTAPASKAFDNWNTASDGSGTSYTDSASFSKQSGEVPNDEITLYAQWKNAGGGGGGSGGSSSGGDYTPPSVKPPVVDIPIEPPVVDLGCPCERFDDVEHDAWYEEYVGYVVENGIMEGISDALFDPNGTTSRAEIIVTLWRIEGAPMVSHPLYFSDISDGLWYIDALRWTNSENIVIGYDDGRFGTEDPVTREQIATILWRYARFKGVDTSSGESTSLLKFSDAKKISAYAISALQWACGEEIIQGTVDKHGNILLDPQGSATRAQIAAILMRFCENIL